MSIELKLQAILETKAALQAALNLPNSVPFSQYAGRINWKDETPPSDLLFADYTKDRYSVSGVPVGFSDVNEFTRLTAATNFVGGELVEYAAGVPRLEAGKGLLIEPQRTNSVLETDVSKWWRKSGVTAVKNNGFTTFTADDTVTSGSELIVYGTDSAGLFPLYYSNGARAISFLVKDDADFMALSVVSSWGGLPHICTVVDIVNSTTTQLNNAPVLSKTEIMGEYKKFTFKVNPHAPGYDRFKFGNSASLSVNTVGNYIGEGYMYTLGYPQVELTKGNATSFIPTKGTPATRAPDILNISLLPTQTITGDWDAGVTYTVADGIATFTGHGYIRNITVEAL